MELPPETTPNPRQLATSIFHPALAMPMSSARAGTPEQAKPTPSPVPLPDRTSHPSPSSDEKNKQPPNAMAPSRNDGPKEAFTLPKLRLEIRDLNHPGAAAFLSAVNATTCLQNAVQDVLSLLYGSPSNPKTNAPPTRSITLVLRPMNGVAFTRDSELDKDHKEIHLSLGYVGGNALADRRADEIAGVLTHEVVHCYQWNGKGNCPGGMIEGVADWVRLRCGLRPPHWRQDRGGKWDAGYQRTAYFLDYLEGRFGDHTVQRINESLRVSKYNEKEFWTGLLGRPVEQLWEDYCEKLKDDEAVLVNKEDISDEDVRLAGQKPKAADGEGSGGQKPQGEVGKPEPK